MRSARITATLCVVLLIIGQVASAPTDDSANIEAVSTSSDADSARHDPLDYEKEVNSYAGEDSVQPRPVAADDDGNDWMAEANAEYAQLLPHLGDDYEDYTSSEDEDSDGDQNEPGSILRSGNMMLTPSRYLESGQDSVGSGFPEIQQKHGIGQTLNSGYYTSEGQSNFPPSQQREVITQTLNPAYTLNRHTNKSRGKTNAAKLLYLMGLLSNAHASSSGGLVGYGQNSQSQSVLSGSSGGHLSYGQTLIRPPATSNVYGYHGLTNSASSGSSSSGSNYDFISNNGRPTASSLTGSYGISSAGGQSFIKLIQPIARFVATQTTSPQKSWSTFLENLNQGQISGSSAYQTLYKQINSESQRQQRLIKLLRRYRKIASQKTQCTRT